MCDSTGEQICKMHKTQTEKNKGLITINLLSSGEIHRQMWLYMLRLLVLVPMSGFPSCFICPICSCCSTEQSCSSEKPEEVVSFQMFQSQHVTEHNPHLLWTPSMLELLERARAARSEVLISEQPFRFSESS